MILPTHLHNARSGNLVIFLLRTVLTVLLPALLRSVGHPFPFEPLRLQRIVFETLFASHAFGNNAFFDVVKNLFAFHFVMTLDACSRRKRAVTLQDFRRQNTCVGLNVVDVLSIISQQLPLILQELDEGMSG